MGQVTNALGVPGEGIHAHRTLGLATFDLIGTITAAGVIAVFFKYNFFLCLIALLALGAAAHVIFRVPTALNKALGIKGGAP